MTKVKCYVSVQVTYLLDKKSKRKGTGGGRKTRVKEEARKGIEKEGRNGR